MHIIWTVNKHWQTFSGLYTQTLCPSPHPSSHHSSLHTCHNTCACDICVTQPISQYITTSPQNNASNTDELGPTLRLSESEYHWQHWSSTWIRSSQLKLCLYSTACCHSGRQPAHLLMENKRGEAPPRRDGTAQRHRPVHWRGKEVMTLMTYQSQH